MDFARTEEQNAIFDMAYGFGQDHIAPHALTWDRQGESQKICGQKWPNWAWQAFMSANKVVARV